MVKFIDWGLFIGLIVITTTKRMSTTIIAEDSYDGWSIDKEIISMISW